MSLSLHPMWNAIGVPSVKAPLNVATFTSYILPPLLIYFLMAFLVIKPKTRRLRVSCWPVLALLALRASVSVDMSLHLEQKFENDLANPMLMIVTRALYWASVKKPLVRHLRAANTSPSTLMDVVDLAFTFRGYGWDWSHGLYVPRETRPSDRVGFVSSVTLSAIVHAFICGTLHRALRAFIPVGFDTIPGATIFDDTLPSHVRYFRSSLITVIGYFTTYGYLQMYYDICTLLGVLILGQDPAQWPPGFDASWRATSLSEFWGRGWHQWLRHMFLVQGGYPLSFIFGRAGLVTGAFLASGMYHYIGIYSLDPTSKLWRMLVGFGMMAPGVLAEQMFKRFTGWKVCGLGGWLWTVTWMLLWGSVIIDGFVRAALFRIPSTIDGVPVWRALVEGVVRHFDTWLHEL
ncbi:hypothetical protein JVU11DRAFT_11902 [Chiua virens]|nr:hypothetical protein JVU11DRAFT_11902 [Chiua virens]